MMKRARTTATARIRAADWANESGSAMFVFLPAALLFRAEGVDDSVKRQVLHLAAAGNQVYTNAGLSRVRLSPPRRPSPQGRRAPLLGSRDAAPLGGNLLPAQPNGSLDVAHWGSEDDLATAPISAAASKLSSSKFFGHVRSARDGALMKLQRRLMRLIDVRHVAAQASTCR
jgi:hypothetical protein